MYVLVCDCVNESTSLCLLVCVYLYVKILLSCTATGASVVNRQLKLSNKYDKNYIQDALNMVLLHDRDGEYHPHLGGQLKHQRKLGSDAANEAADVDRNSYRSVELLESNQTVSDEQRIGHMLVRVLTPEEDNFERKGDVSCLAGTGAATASSSSSSHSTSGYVLVEMLAWSGHLNSYSCCAQSATAAAEFHDHPCLRIATSDDGAYVDEQQRRRLHVSNLAEVSSSASCTSSSKCIIDHRSSSSSTVCLAWVAQFTYIMACIRSDRALFMYCLACCA